MNPTSVANRTLKHPESQFGPQNKLLTQRCLVVAGALLGPKNHPVGTLCALKSEAEHMTAAT